MTTHDFAGRVALVTGAGSGLGHSHATALARLGAKVMVNDLRAEHGETPAEKTAAEVAAELRARGFEAEGSAGSVADEGYSVGLVHETVERFGRIDIVVNNAGCPGFGTAQETSTEFLRTILDVNLLSYVWTMRTALGYMREQNYGRIVNTSSGTATFGSAGMFAYITAKAGVLGITKAAALDNTDRDIRVNAICPVAYTVMSRDYFGSRADHIDLDDFDPRRVTPLVLFLSHQDCELTGEVLSGGAGRWARIFTGKTAGPEKISEDIEDVFASLDTILDVGDYTILKDTQSQYDRK